MLYADLRVMLDTLINIDNIQGEKIYTEYAILIKNALIECSKQDTRVRVSREKLSRTASFGVGDLFELTEYKRSKGLFISDGWESLILFFPDDNDSVIRIGFAVNFDTLDFFPDYNQIYDLL